MTSNYLQMTSWVRRTLCISGFLIWLLPSYSTTWNKRLVNVFSNLLWKTARSRQQYFFAPSLCHNWGARGRISAFVTALVHHRAPKHIPSGKKSRVWYANACHKYQRTMRISARDTFELWAAKATGGKVASSSKKYYIIDILQFARQDWERESCGDAAIDIW